MKKTTTQTATLDEAALALHRQHRGKLGTKALFPVETRAQLSLIYTPGVAAVSRAIMERADLAFDLTSRGRTIAVISDGSAVLGLGNIGASAALPVMEGKSLLLKVLAGVDSVPLVIASQEVAQVIEFVRLVAPSFAGINLEDISAPHCFAVEEALQDLGIPVFHDDQHGTAIVVMAALLNASRAVGKPFEELRVVVVGAGAAGLAVSKMLLGLSCQADSCARLPGARRVRDLIVVDSHGALVPARANLNIYKQAVAGVSNSAQRQGGLDEVIGGADVVIGVSGPGSILPAQVKQMAPKAIVFALANPTPEIMPAEAMKAGAHLVATGRSDFPNQINNVLAFPGLFRAVIELRLPRITQAMKQAAAFALTELVEKPNLNEILPDVFDPRVVPALVKAIKECHE